MKQKNIKGLISEYFIFLIFIALVVVLTCLKPSFIAPTNLVNILKQASINGILAFGMMFVIIAGGFDMSVGSTVAFTGILAALLGKGDLPLIVPLVVAMLAGLATVGVVLVWQFGSSALFHYSGFVLSAMLLAWSALSHQESTLAIRPVNQGASVPDGFSVWHHLDANGIRFKSITPQDDVLLIKFDSRAQSAAAKVVLDRTLPHGYIIAQQEDDSQPAAWLSLIRDTSHRFG